ncbi:uncharacterized protein FOMMEDRAFT_31043 [Fomitiporia mediterranea MF3/22]|uniref:uncharacterized protein n=1 Tax=Fomitiporia mediterranea (strain MF3/22) TaxID=694068 RepID=UPI0004409A2A|nr:uncharacterized protein FOMMEDRAFT_31043 [Fomitiporia mediterranea MF3/22]EJC99767.1 hypothetical protein FOMMEDRAFT_31043 [Fomitiporia mediterranea MF3/22]
MSNDAFSETLQFITTVKLNELSKRNDKFVKYASRVNKKANEHSDNDPSARLRVLVDGLNGWPNALSSDFSCHDILRYLKQARHDPGFPPSIVDEWTCQAEAQFEHEGTRFDFARLFGMLLNDWLNSKSINSRGASLGSSGVAVEENVTAEGQKPALGGYEKVDRKETVEQKAKLESLIFEEKKIDVAALNNYLKGLFSSKTAKEDLEYLRFNIRTFASSLNTRKISTTELKQVILSVLQSDVLSEKKQATLKEFLRNPIIMEELVSVLDMQLSTINSWSWPVSGVLLEPRRHLNGRTRFYLDAEILTCLLLHFLGVLWSVEFKSELRRLLESRIWKQLPKKLSQLEHQRRDIFCGKESYCVDEVRRRYNEDHYFMCQLPSNFADLTDHYNENDNNSHVPRTIRSLRGSDSQGPQFESPVHLKQSLLHILSADVAFNKALHGQCTVVRTDLEWFGPSLPFDTITTVLRFFGVPKENVKFMKAFLSCPVMFKGDPSNEARVRKRGVPISYAFSTLFGELVMFIMDFAVNQKADGLSLHRIHDDFWFWDSSSERCAVAWAEMQRFSQVAGLTFNSEKTGSAVVGGDEMHPGLPRGDVRWGFLRMDATQKGQFIVDQDMVDKHIEELRRQLAATSSVFGWVQAYNKYIAFIVRNCGAPAVVWGKEHIDSVIDTIARVQRALFSVGSDGGNQASFAGAISKMIEDKFHISTKDVPCGWYLWPNAAGGLEVKDALVDLFLVRDGFGVGSVESTIENASWKDEWEYDKAKRLWESGETTYRSAKISRISSSTAPGEDAIVKANDPFFSFDEFKKGREERGEWWCTAYKRLLDRPQSCSVTLTPKLEASLKLLGDGIGAFGGSDGAMSGWNSLRPYWKWIIALHHDQMVKKFGSLAVVDPTSVPVGMVSVFKSSRMKWEQ